MASKGRGSPPTIKKELLSRSFEFSFFQVIRLLRLLANNGAMAHGEKDSSEVHRAIKVRPELTLGFPAADVSSIEARDDEDKIHYQVTATFLGLYGTSSPLPTFYTEDLLAEAGEDETVSRDFLDILNQRIYELLYKCWIKYRLYINVIEEQDINHIERLFCLLGLGELELRSAIPNPFRLIRYLGLISQHPRSALGLKTLLNDALGGVPVNIEQCILRTAPIPEDQRPYLGNSGSSLGKDVFVGKEIQDRTGKFRIVVGPLGKKDFQRLLPGTKRHELLIFLTNFYLSSPLEYDVKLILSGAEAEPTRLGDPEWAKLGWTTWLFCGEYVEETSIIFQPQTS